MNSAIRFGKWKGLTVRGVIERDPKYCRWLVANPFFKERYADQYRVLRGAVIDDLLAEVAAEQTKPAAFDLV